MRTPGRPRVPEHRKRKKLNTTIPSYLIEAATQKAESLGMDLSRFVEEAVRSLLKVDTREEDASGQEGDKEGKGEDELPSDNSLKA
jgi:hypothetical protein